MLQRILVPLDGSALSDRALSFAALIAGAQGAVVTLLRVLEVELIPWNRVDDAGYEHRGTYQPMVSGMRSEARDRLEYARDMLVNAGVTVEVELDEGRPTDVLLARDAELHSDLCIMATHGRTGLARLALGSMADRMLRLGSSPVLLVPAFGPATACLERALVPLDGSPLAEQALQMTGVLAGNPLLSAQLLTVLGDAPVDPTSADPAVTSATAYLRSVQSRLTAKGLSTLISVVAGNAAEAIEAASTNADIVIMSTHGRGGFDRLRHGSVAERATRHLRIPRLLIRAVD